MPNYIYTLQALAKSENVTSQYLRLLIHRLNKAGKPLQWRGYRFISTGDNKAWIAVPEDSDIEFIAE